MSCEHYEKYMLGETESDVYHRHLKACATCRKLVEQDERLLSLSGSLDRYPTPPALWDRIETGLESEFRTKHAFLGLRWWTRTKPLLRLAAVCVLIFGLGYLIRPLRHVPENGLLSDRFLVRVERKERAYLRAIGHLEKRIEPRIESLDLELSLLYQDRLDTIDSQIRACRAALEGNPANGHIRRYMLAALQEKQSTLEEIREIRRKG